MTAPDSRLAVLEPFAAMIPEENRGIFWGIAQSLPQEQIDIFNRVAPSLIEAIERDDFDSFVTTIRPELESAGYGTMVDEYAGLVWGILHQ